MFLSRITFHPTWYVGMRSSGRVCMPHVMCSQGMREWCVWWKEQRAPHEARSWVEGFFGQGRFLIIVDLN